MQNDRVYAPNNAKKRDIAAERLLRCRTTFSSSLMVSVAVSKLGCTELFFVEPDVKVDGRYYREVFAEEADASFKNKKSLLSHTMGDLRATYALHL